MRLIDADKLIQAMSEYGRSETEVKNCFWYAENIISLIVNAPTIEERKQGTWTTDNLVRPFGICSQCGQICETENFCGNCGADMRGGDNNG